jgi:hypothetical protein
VWQQFDQFAKSILERLLRPVGTVHPQHEVRLAAQAVDMWFEPVPGHEAERARLGPLGRISTEACMLEPFHAAPGLREVRSCIRKQYNLAHWQEQEAEPTAREPSFPRLWILAGGRPESVLARFEMRAMDGWLAGFWHAAEGHALHVVVLRELPEIRETLLLRLLGDRRTYLRAAAELGTLPRDAWERQLAVPLMVAFRLEQPSGVDSKNVDEDTMEYTEKLERLYAEWEQQVEERGFREAFVTVYETRFGEMPAELRAAVARVQGDEELRRLTALGVTHPLEDVIAAVRQASGAG